MPLWINFKPKLIGEGWEREKTKLYFGYVPIRHVIKNSQKNSKIIQKIKKYHYGFISSKNRLEKTEKEWK